MKTLGNWTFRMAGYIAAIILAVLLYNSKHAENVAKDTATKTEEIKQHPVATIVDSAGNEHVRFKDGSTAQIPTTEDKKQMYRILRDSTGSALSYLLDDKKTEVTQVTRVSSTTTGNIPKAAIDSVKSQKSIPLDKWMTVFDDGKGGLDYSLNSTFTSASHRRKTGLFGLVQSPYVDLGFDNPKAKINGFERYSYPVPFYKPKFKVYTEARYDVVNDAAQTDLAATYRIGQFEVGGFGRLFMSNVQSEMHNQFKVTAGAGISLRFNIVEQ